ncbi:MAG: flagellar type III secretion system pore protein FliP [Desulfobacterales bacterium]|nr:flagellar type III secretion system pore protein FliP [Desulfobacterales bacterium]
MTAGFLCRSALLIGIIFIFFNPGSADSAPIPLPSFQIGVEDATGPEEVSTVLQIVALLTILSIAPAILILTTSFTRIVIIFHFLRQAIGTQSTPPNQVLAGLALFITFFIMSPIWNAVYQDALRPYMDEEISYRKAFEEAQVPVRKFMLNNTREADLALFVKVSKAERPKTKDDISMLALIPAFVISELKTAFIIGFVLYIPFLIIDMVVASVLLSMGMMMLPPVMISLPFKLILFVLVDGWNLVVGSIISSFKVF